MEDEKSTVIEFPSEAEQTALPVPAGEVREEKETEETSGAQTPQKRSPGIISRIAGGAFSIIFCGLSLFYMTARAVDDVSRLTSNGADRLLAAEVYGAPAPETHDETEAPPDTETPAVAEDTKEAPVAETAHESNTYPIEYESLANFDLTTDLFNETSYSPDLPAVSAKKCGVGKLKELQGKYGADAPVVLIVHTHGTEAYSNGVSYSADESFRTEDASQNVVAVGDVMETVLRAEGIGVIHSREMFDRSSYSESYSNSYAAVASFLAEYPSISYVIDVHRDSVFRQNGACVATDATVCGEPSAQVMIVVGTDEGGANHPTWEKNLSLAMNVQSAMASLEPSVPRKVDLRSAAFNQGLSSGSLLFEIGSCGNTLSEAKRAAAVAALSLAWAIKGDEPSLGVKEAVALSAP